MALFGLFGRKKESGVKAMPKPPTPPSTLELGNVEKPVPSPQHVDDLGFGASDKDVEEFKPAFELPDLEVPKLELPSFDEEEIKGAIEKEALPKEIKRERPKKEEIPHELPDLEHLPEPKSKKEEFELVRIEEPIELKPTPSVRGPVFIRSDQFKLIKGNVNGLRETLGKAEETLNNISEIKNREDSEYEEWHSSSEAIQRKLLYVDRMLFEK